MCPVTARFTIVTIASDTAGNLSATLTAIGETMTGASFQSIIVANGIEVGQAFLSKLRFQSTLLRTAAAVSPGALLNSAVERAEGEYVAFLPAGAILEPHWGVAATAAFEHAEVAGVVPRVLDGTGTLVRACGTGIRFGRLAHIHAGLQRDAVDVLRPTVLDLAPLCGFVLRRQHVATVGGYDADFPASLFDYDWTLRARLKGLAIAYRPDFTLRYDGSLPLGQEHGERSSTTHFFQRWQTVFTPHLNAETFLS